ncbi:sigma-70 family RNA polymerase sigma factor [Synechococcus sp. RSCCF101]|uniref:sigma-70 family RNA polymerase sigma factor n=1 Tax=Synechococcus sp. RSCCF101 TaxID=2511069 RepID=UPI001243E2F1|nr:sigma-70 family RNA polymerase sigma factor [Synechococcus sp. RSCCF101]QEY33309.1 sigma-70 family RNA polymerase sigma factor [Synechococcus sp. RSCCF101]
MATPSRVPTSGLTAYMGSIGSISRLTTAEEIELGRRIQLWRRSADPDGPCRRRGRRARDRMITANLRLVVALARSYRDGAARLGLSFSDLIQEGNIGLARAADRFDPEKGYRFSTYATWWIREAMGRCLAEQGRLIRLPLQVSQLIQKASAIRRSSLQERGRLPSRSELAEAMALSPDRLRGVLGAAALRTTSGDVRLHGGEGSTLLELQPDARREPGLDPTITELALKPLTVRERQVIRGVVFEDRPLREMARELGCSSAAVSATKRRALNRLRDHMASGNDSAAPPSRAVCRKSA